MQRIVGTKTNGHQNSSFSNAHEILNILIGSLIENERSEEPVILRDEGQFSGGGLADLTDVECKIHLLLEESIGGMLTATAHVFSESVFCTVPGAGDEKKCC